ncbi:MAG: hypothetical protein Q8S13_02240 [Dehalococcoidia bacterium]|nr:hypothetical protein [Dehalococcoidia bacterium]
MRLPEACPIFRVLNDGPMLRLGALVEGVGPAVDVRGGARSIDGEPVATRGYLAVRVLDEGALLPKSRRMLRPPDRMRHPDGWVAIAIRADGIEPLTSAAREQLALIEAP